MASDAVSQSVNGTYASQNHAPTEQNLAAHNAHNAQNTSNSNGTPAASAPSESLTKEEVGWYFVERYYTTLSKSPEKLFLYYNKRSQSVFGVEEEKAPVCVGQRSIQDRITELDFQDCKVRVSNVDAQESGDAIIIQVIGEISNKSQPHRKFVQTFVLATQTNGYFVLNDVFRYIAEEELETVGGQEAGTDSPAPQSTSAVPAEVPSVVDVSAIADAQQQDAEVQSAELKHSVESAEKADVSAAQVNGSLAAAGKVNAEAREQTNTSGQRPTPEAPASEVRTEQPKDAKPASAKHATATQAVTEQPAQSKPAAPKTWASMAATAASKTSNRQAAVSVATPVPRQPTPSQAAAPSSSPSAAEIAADAPASATQEQAQADVPQNDGWQAVGAEHARKQSRAQIQTGNEPVRFRAYIKNVFQNVDGDMLKSKLQTFGEVSYFDISRGKNCAFVDFATQDGFEKAIKGSPLTFGSSQVVVEERRERPMSFQPRGGMRGGRGGADSRGGAGRGSFGGKEGTRGSFQQRGRGNPAGRGRGAIPTA